uniref:60S ribosomal protein L13 n=2 Tax=Giardia intestinalis (strain ATCC 50803 / WB clone C6) TaxID=184922 RepID=A0ABF7PHF1_GIAIC|nr:Chain L, 60S ribosomal protein L13 [Giardia lamblia ATCC 50803]7PWO_L2 Chain L2, 60S ribosomal protein L13 [Giardia lamblia ATCC 50803]8BR8_LM Chain LM, 60S ribosomal protein L13 [Giardia lamblia ATCC 50803]8BRM_LM Chain LM, Ribosomal protein L13 [Giardia lamblia ATCC 50803]8BSI_LM Chain LM, 60S ribosomal protein L13 [Giardia intestinalis]8BSJ_LM Chain LM, 60S ribosomal protein L13 [Giardia intestinalis]8BTD_LM Chain LM, Ribosomal protein L13 [Giardia lamblia ATCC 50803]8BTR_LM Chain LM, |eukprot:XP_001709018.1 Ribosomal protein L13 [Giardia lamblia ATCC 50803]
MASYASFILRLIHFNLNFVTAFCPLPRAMGRNVAFSNMRRYKCTNKGPNLIKNWFNQPARKIRRRQTRLQKAKAIFPCPLQKLRPSVTRCSQKFNLTQRIGRGFTLRELQGVGLSAGKARQIGIAVDPRRKNKSEESVARNVARLKEYLSKVTIFSKQAKPEEIQQAIQHQGVVMPVVNPKPVITTGSIAEAKKEVPENLFMYLRNARTARNRARLAKRDAEREAAAKTKGGKK